MRKIFISLIILFFALAASAQRQGTRPTPYGFDINAKPPIFYNLFLEMNPGGKGLELKFNINIQYDLLYFIKTDSGYVSGYDIALYAKETKTGETVFSQLWKENIREEKFEVTNSQRRYHITSKSFSVDFPPGKYQLDLDLTDETTGREYKSNRPFTVPDLTEEYYLSDIVFLTQDKSQSAEIILPDNDIILEFNKDLYPYFQFDLMNAEKVNVKSELFRLDEDHENLLRKKEASLNEKGVLHHFSEVIVKKDLKEGKYLLRYTLSTDRLEKNIEKKFRIVWYQKPIPMYNLEMALLPMRYLLSDEEWEKIYDYSEEDQRNWYQSYWEKKDPDPDTPMNEVQVEFYKRVMEANSKFRTENYQGWDTDRGKALILYGDPDRVRAKKYLEDAKSYEIWYYKQRNKKLIFIDRDEDGAYILVSIEDIGKEDDE